MKILKNTALIVVFSVGIYCLGHQYKKASALDNLIYQHIQTASIQSSSYLQEARAMQNNSRLSATAQSLAEIDAHLASGEQLKVLAKGQAILETDPGNLAILLRLGIVHLQQQEDLLAYEELLTIYKAPSIDATLKTEAAWYLALLQSQKKQWKTSQHYLQEVLNNYTPYRQPAQKLLAEVELRL